MAGRGVRRVAAVVAALLAGGAWVAVGGDDGSPVGSRGPAPSPSATPSATASPTPAAPSSSPTRPAASPAPVQRPVPAAVPRRGCPPPPRPPSQSTPKPQPPPKVAESAVPAPLAVAGKAASLDVVRGKGLWVTPWPSTDLEVPALVAQAQRLGVRSLWVRTGGSRQGYYGEQFLPRLVPAAHAAGIAVIAWDFPTLSDPVADARRAQRALAAGIDAFAPDVETKAEGTYPTPRRISSYLSIVRRAAGDRPVVATVPRPSPQRRDFPYRSFVPYSDAFAPMVYWSCREPGALVQNTISALRPMLPVAPVGQAYDMGPEGGRVGVPTKAETLRFLDAARRAGAIGASLWTVEHAGRDQLRALGSYRWR